MPAVDIFIIGGAKYRSAAEVLASKPWLQNVRLVGRRWYADDPEAGAPSDPNGWLVGSLPDDMSEADVPAASRGSAGYANYALTKQGDYYGSGSGTNAGLLPLPGLGLLGPLDLAALKKYLPWILAGLILLALVAASRDGRKGRAA